eukprot:gnl/TRDRNA2_/TRDRNA2_112088_c0_seq1.p1 gnl/TRDRNA2_/TRDRNA2_112088_c0~~gnl/TRDRNA2_/TRDRNA2_112088_c0_seq1.p1  ORF type:complete len:294 (+),score=27.59 gnl/TRDRNA2_/TRDRNA2_112088_c0_seq1:54-935(+)
MSVSSMHILEAGEPGWTERAAASLHENGFCVLRGSGSGSLAPEGLCDRCAEAACFQLEEYEQWLQQLGFNTRKDKFMFAEVCARSPGCLRYDLALPVMVGSGSAACGDTFRSDWAELQLCLDQWARPVLQASGLLCADAASNTDGASCSNAGCDRAGCVISLPGAPDQHWHKDSTMMSSGGGSTGLVTAFMALVPVDSVNGQTEFEIGSHKQGDGLFGSTFTFDDEPPPELVRTDLSKGDVLLFDYDVYHRGRGNRASTARPLAYIVYNRVGVTDRHNFPERSLRASVLPRYS